MITNENTQVAGLLSGDYNIEFIGIKETKKVLFLRNGKTYQWEELPKSIFDKCKKKYKEDEVAQEQLSKYEPNRQVELYIYHLYGDLDYSPDVLNGELTESENFRHSQHCESLQWKSKWITIGSTVLKDRDLTIIDCVKKDYPDKMIADVLGITQSTFDYHKKKLFRKLNVHTKTGLIVKALKYNI